LLAIALKGGEDGREAIRLLEVFALQKVLDTSRRGDGRGSSDDVFDLFDGADGDEGGGGRSGQRGSDSLMKIRRSIVK
jgi:uncharacterized membrane protein YgcG